ncbi:RidA/YER057c/UK114 superfamily, group 6 [hydrothermal vent metagenome]|uniref:RidA/YER057c/UK114 superfamily, group 6 n=1 Tax=hydrothermal vent metagenome TaxID=652676 RepID=A0A3B0SFG9_9ZZZZ
MSKDARTFSGSPWESQVGYCRAIRRGPHVWVSGTAPVADDGSCFAPGEPYAQAVKCLQIIEQALAKLDVRMEHITRTRMFVTDISQWSAFGRAHGEIFKAHPPATSMLEVKALIDPKMLIEIEAEAFVF